MKYMTPSLLLTLLLFGCRDQGPTGPMLEPDVRTFAAKPDCEVDPNHPACKDGSDDPAGYSFAYPATEDEAAALGGDCWYPDPGGEPGWGTLNPFGRDFRCPVVDETGSPLVPVLKFQVLDGGSPVSTGSVKFWRCENVETGEPVRWDLCGVRQRPPYKKLFESREYHTDLDLSDGIAEVTFTDRVVLYDSEHYPNQPEELGWGGFRWKYVDGPGQTESEGSPSFNIRPIPQGSTG